MKEQIVNPGGLQALSEQIAGLNPSNSATNCNSLSDVGTMLDNALSTMSANENKVMRIAFTNAVAPFSATSYAGSLIKVDNQTTYAFVQFHPIGLNTDILCYRNGTGWHYDSYALNSKIENLRQSVWFAQGTKTFDCEIGDIVILHDGVRNFEFVVEQNNYSVLTSNNYSSGLSITVSGTTVTIINSWYDLYCTVYKA